MPTTRTVAFGRPAVEALRDEIVRAKAADPLAPVTVAVPSNYAGLSLRRLLASGRAGDASGTGRGGLVNVSFLPVARVTELVGAPSLAAQGRRPLTAAITSEAIRAVLSDQAGELFGPVRFHPATERSLARAVAELRPLSPDALDALAGASPRAGEVVRLFRATWARLSGGWYDDHDLALAAAAVARAPGATTLDDLGRLVVYLPRRITPALADFLDALGDRAVVIEGAAPDDAAPAVQRLVRAGDPDDEVRAALRYLMARAADPVAPVPLHRMGLLFGGRRPYAVLAHQQLAAAGIPFTGPAVLTLAATVAGTTLMRLLALADHGWRRDDVTAWLASGPLRDDARNRTVPAARWDRLSRAAGVVGGEAQWVERLDALATQLEDDGIARDDEPEWRRRRRLDDAAEARAFASFLDEVRGALDITDRATSPAAADAAVAAGRPIPTTWGALAAWACGLLDRFLGPERAHGGWPTEQQDAWLAVRAAIERLATLDEVGHARGTDLPTFRRTLERELDAPAGRVGTFDDGVFVATVGAARGVDLDVVAVVGLAEGTLPGHGGDDALLPDVDRRVVEGRLPLRADRFEQERLDYLAALATAPERLATWPEGDLRGGHTRLPSRWLLDAASAIAGRRVWSDDLDELSRTHPDAVALTSSFLAGAADATEPASLSDRDLGSLARWHQRGGDAGHHPVTVEAGLAPGFEAWRSRQSSQLTRFDGRLPAGLVPVPGPDEALSPTSLETMASCPFKYLLGRVLRLSADERPEEIERISAMDRGSLVHGILERYILERIDGAPRSPERLQELATEEFAAWHARGLTGKVLFWQWDQAVIRRELVQFARHDAEGGEPIAAELAFGMEGEPSVSIDLDDGRRLSFRGKADRVDRRADGSLEVTDYKTGSARSYEGIATDPVDAGKHLQLPLYGLAARAAFGAQNPGAPIHTRYWFVSEKGRFDSIGSDLDEALPRFRDVLGILTGTIAAGTFPSRPGDASWWDGRNTFEGCQWCEFDRVCSTDRDRAWARKRAEPDLAPYVRLAEEQELAGAAEDGDE